ncbi:hypothetical protein D915_004311 [Fasciola hepatica]|uniref:EF-hand domain-containing protein n=1 Tax=Fasciola hepatica TaxID=6192 RepID=A0A4E0RAB7_FASHE|nr:hypothetical protein D915_004311 [Fasciola hepatica]
MTDEDKKNCDKWAQLLLDRLDQKKDGRLSVDEISAIAPCDGLKKRVAGLIKKYDTNNDGMVEVKDLRNWMQDIIKEVESSRKNQSA